LAFSIAWGIFSSGVFLFYQYAVAGLVPDLPGYAMLGGVRDRRVRHACLPGREFHQLAGFQ
jgi:hypothetical protein